MRLRDLLVLALIGALIPVGGAESAKVVFISGKPSHPHLEHEHRAGNILLAKRLSGSGLNVEGIVLSVVGYPASVGALDDAASVVLFCTGNKGHLINRHWTRHFADFPDRQWVEAIQFA